MNVIKLLHACRSFHQKRLLRMLSTVRTCGTMHLPMPEKFSALYSRTNDGILKLFKKLRNRFRQPV